ncbi:aldehyde reductase (AKR1), putative [Talaromyces stipitatus ATCC 10500]|uniref:D-xylose reductase [NAD(P)H] n=1 Tax=Talaromyces stipitatus (strain ATCC 10500 / CBS 375.48 / QM 6759 / NRRL 1006) TaxID=441959 RepID=B8MDI3_TALSN|nr:aldehyde reductase (AKR1), putative [Talaromyces stipitatus ATCC 10500]EED17946.1 aldehyde reductase (AKR1), putative [Talaromyces stipitatus ATCC 10500]
MSLGKTATLNTGAKIPLRGYGTWQAEPGQVGEGVYLALKAGYRHIDLAKIYQNQKEVGEGLRKALKELGIKREDVFITSKLWNSQFHPDVVEAALDDTLQELGLEYLDLYLIHWPVAFKSNKQINDFFPREAGNEKVVAIDDEISIIDTWTAVTKLPKSKARAVGVSNYNIEHIEAIIKATGVVPAVNQIERHPYLPNPPLIEYAKEKGIHITGYSGFGNNSIGEPLIITRPEVKSVAEAASKRTGTTVTPAQVVLAWAQVGGHSVIPKSVTASRIVENLTDVELSADEIAAIDALGKENKRFNIPGAYYDPLWPINIFHTPEEEAHPEFHKVVVSK